MYIRSGNRILIMSMIFTMLIDISFAGDPAAESRDAVMRVLKNMAARAQEHYFMPASLGGGNGSFTNSKGGVTISFINQIGSGSVFSVGEFSLGTITATCLHIYGEGTAVGDDGGLVNVEILVFADSIAITFNN